MTTGHHEYGGVGALNPQQLGDLKAWLEPWFEPRGRSGKQTRVVGGTATVAWPGGDAQSTVTTVTHEIGGTPDSVVATVDAAGIVDTATFALIPIVGSIGATTFNVFVITADGSTPPNTGAAAVCWVATLAV